MENIADYVNREEALDHRVEGLVGGPAGPEGIFDCHISI
jgi:hypothetical protein